MPRAAAISERILTPFGAISVIKEKNVSNQNEALFRFLSGEDASMRQGEVTLDCRGESERHSDCLHGHSLAMVYSPCQAFRNMHEPAEGLCRGTIFAELEKPFMGGRGR